MAVSTIIPYPGAKWRAWDIIKPLIPRDITDWREPFFGGGSMSLLMADDIEFKLEKMIVGDLAPEVWAFWRGVQENAEEVVEEAKKMFTEWCPTHAVLQKTPLNDPNYQEIYDKAVEEAKAFKDWSDATDLTQMTLSQRSARMFIINGITFSAMGDSGTISAQKYAEWGLERCQRLIDVQPLLKKMEIKNCSFEETMKDVDPEKTFVFLDPPYYNQGKSSPMYGRGGDTHRGFPHEGLADFLSKLPCRWLMTYDDSVVVRKMYRNFNVKPFKLVYTMASNPSEDALDGEEVFVANYDIDDKEDEDLMALL